jgi:hypothetical protein
MVRWLVSAADRQIVIYRHHRAAFVIKPHMTQLMALRTGASSASSRNFRPPALTYEAPRRDRFQLAPEERFHVIHKILEDWDAADTDRYNTIFPITSAISRCA